MPWRSSSARSGRAARTSSGVAIGMTSCSTPVSTHSGRPARASAGSPTIAASSASVASTARVTGGRAVRKVQLAPSPVTGTRPAIISSATP